MMILKVITNNPGIWKKLVILYLRNASYTFVINNPFLTRDNENDNESFNAEAKENSDEKKEKEQFDFDEWLAKLMDIEHDGSETSTKNKVRFLFYSVISDYGV